MLGTWFQWIGKHYEAGTLDEALVPMVTWAATC